MSRYLIRKKPHRLLFVWTVTCNDCRRWDFHSRFEGALIIMVKHEKARH